ncbi:MAG: TonB-dependent receptor plug domain-containing protein [Myxococcaceae bacterium]
MNHASRHRWWIRAPHWTLVATAALSLQVQAVADDPAIVSEVDKAVGEAAAPAEDAVDFFFDLDQRLQEKVVTASGGQAEARRLTPATVASITREEIERHGWRSLAEILNYVPGIYVVDDQVLPSVGVRATTPGLSGSTRHIKVMINGVPVNFRPDLAAFIGPEYIPVEAIKRVEIAKGPLSALYGANAFTATVNVITEQAEEEERVSVSGRLYNRGSGLSTGLSGFASTGNETAGALVAFTSDRTDRSGLAIRQTFPGQDPNDSRFSGFFADRSRDDIASPTSVFLAMRAGTQSVGNFTLQGGFQGLDALGEFQLNSVTTHRSRYSLHNLWANLVYRKALGSNVDTVFSATGSGGYPTKDDKQFLTLNNLYSFTRNFNYRSLDLNATVNYKPVEVVTLGFGVDASLERHQTLFYTQEFLVPEGSRNIGDRVDLVSTGDRTQADLAAIGAYLSGATTPFVNIPGLKFWGNFRLDWSNLFRFQYSWRVAAAYAIGENHAIKIFAGSSYQSPSPVLLFGLSGFGNNNNVVGSRTRTNPATGLPYDLRQQRVTSAEIAWSSVFAGGILTLEGSVFGQQVEDKIAFVLLATNYLARNQGIQRNVGLEFIARLALNRFSPYLAGNAQLVFDTDPITGATALSDRVPESFPVAFGYAGIDINIPEALLALNVHARFTGPRGATDANIRFNNTTAYSLPFYATLDVSIRTMNLKLIGGKETRFMLSGRNLTASRYSEPGFGGFDIPQIGRTLFFELRQSF